MKETRTERDAMGEIEVPANAYWGVNTERALRNFRISGQRFPEDFILAIVQIKKACAISNMELEKLDRTLGRAIVSATDEVITDRKFLDQFPVDVYQTGSGTQTNMNVNEVLANRADEILGHPRGQKKPVHPNDHVNMGQSSNDVIPTAMHLATILTLDRDLVPSLEKLIRALDNKVAEFSGVVKIARTHLQDAVPIPLSTEFSVYRAQAAASLERVRAARNELMSVPIGGTAVGTGLNVEEGFVTKVITNLSRISNIQLRVNPVKAEGIASHSAIVVVSAALRSLALSCLKLANDIRWMASGPRAGLGELLLPENEPGSSIMPGKVNPTQSEALIEVCLRVMGNDETIVLAEAYGSVLDLNVTKPLLVVTILESIRILANGMTSFVEHCLRGITPNMDRIDRELEESLMVVTRLAPVIGYDQAAKIAKNAHSKGINVKQALEDAGIVVDKEMEDLIDPRKMV